MGANRITVYEGNSLVVECTITNSDGTAAVLTGYTATLTVKANKSDTTTLFTSTGIIAANVVNFTITAANNTRDTGVFYYEVTISDSTSYYTVVQDRYYLKQSIVYVT